MRSVLALTALAATAFAQSLTEALGGQSDLSALTTLLGSFPAVVSALGNATNITLLAPSNEAITKLIASPSGNATLAQTDVVSAILTYHVLTGTYKAAQVTDKSAFIPTLLTSPLLTNVTGGQVVDAATSDSSVVFTTGLLTESTVTKADIAFNGGVIHIIDTVLSPPAKVSTTATFANLTSLVSALSTANLVSTVDETPDLTIFAPNDAAFAAIQSTIAGASVETLTSVLGYHVIAGSVVYSSKITGNVSVPTLNGASLDITVVNGDVYVNKAKVILADVLVANGVVHVIDGVLLPPAASNGTASNGTAPATNGTAPSGNGTTTGPSPTASSPVPTGAAAKNAPAALALGALFMAALAL